jgi:hypothetical protein
MGPRSTRVLHGSEADPRVVQRETAGLFCCSRTTRCSSYYRLLLRPGRGTTTAPSRGTGGAVVVCDKLEAVAMRRAREERAARASGAAAAVPESAALRTTA